MGNPIVRLTVMTINPSGSPPQDTKTFSTNIGNICEIHKTELITGYYNSKFYVFCTSLDQLSNFLFTFDGSTIGEGIPVNTSIQKVKTFTPVGSANGSTSWALVTNDTSIFGVSLSEPNVGAFTILPGRISYSDPNSGSKGNGGSNNNNSGNNNNGNNNGRNNNDGSSGPNGGKSQSSTQDSEGLPTIAIVFMVIIPAMLAFGIFTWFRRKSRKQGTEVIVADFLPMEPAASHSTLHSSGSQYPLMTLSETSQSYGQTDQGHHVHATHVPYPPLPVATAYPGYPPVPPKQTEDDYYHKVSITGGPQALPQVPGNPQTHVMGSVDLRSPSSVVASPYSSNASTVVGSGFSTPMTVHSRLALESAQLHSVPHSPHGPYAMSPELEDPSRNPQVYVIPVSAPQLYGPGIISGAANVTETGHGVEYRRAPQDRHEVYGSQDYHS
ncbi:hypothetical protein BGW38_000224 [Lunasporangiospora selenospora]|uniref:Uncharacterized protein n=1 Tax=Lunasporangiospora selenospora TaxID=979761 RepID=A0A9P6FXB2_9FUNG|nr:hypothetical protein BGW38_000224 [Lunasporangiospora selenospora]